MWGVPGAGLARLKPPGACSGEGRAAIPNRPSWTALPPRRDTAGSCHAKAIGILVIFVGRGHDAVRLHGLYAARPVVDVLEARIHALHDVALRDDAASHVSLVGRVKQLHVPEPHKVLGQPAEGIVALLGRYRAERRPTH